MIRLGRVTQHVFDNLGREIQTILPDPDGSGEGHPLESPVWQYTFDAANRLLSTIAPNGGVTTYEYDLLDNLVHQVLPDPDGSGGGNPLTSPEYFWVYDAASQLVSEEDPLGRITLHNRDFLGREIETVLPDPDGPGGGNPLASPVWQFTFDANSNLISTVDPLGNTTTRTLDNLGRQIALTLPDPDGPGGGNPLTSPVYQWVFDAASQVTSEIDPLGGVTQHVLDNLGREIQTILPDPDGPGGGNPLESPVWQFSFDVMSNLVSTVDPMAAETTYQFDLLNRRIKTIDAESGETSFVFDAVNNLVSLTDSVGNTTTWFRDNLNRVIEEENENEDSRYFQYDAASNLTQRTDRNGRVTEWNHDNLGRTLAERWMDGVTPLHTITYVLDAASQLTEASDAFSSFAFLYDDLGRISQETQGITGLTPEIVLAKTWDASGNRLSLSATIGEEADFQNVYAHDNLNRVTQIVQQGQSGGSAVATKRFDIGYNALGQYSTLDRYQSADTSEFVATTTYDYDLAHRLASLVHSQGETVLAGYAFTYDAASRIDSIDSVIDGLSTFTYDATSQLTAADHTGQADESHVWDANGNPMGEDFEVGPNNRLLEDAAFLYEYDAEGNLIKKTDKVSGDYMTFEWDYRNRLTSVKFYDSEDTLLKTVDHSYDLFNRWIRRTVDDDGPGGDDPVDTFFAGYDGLDATLQFEGNDAEDLSKRYAWGPAVDQLLAAENVDSLESAGDVLWPFADQLGTPRDLATYDSGENETSIANHRVYNASGSLTSETNSSVVLVFSFTGKPLDASTGLIQFVNRWYDPHTQRWLSPDPLGLGPDTNDVRYVGNNIANLTDPTGLKPPSDGGPKAAYGPPSTNLNLYSDPSEYSKAWELYTKGYNVNVLNHEDGLSDPAQWLATNDPEMFKEFVKKYGTTGLIRLEHVIRWGWKVGPADNFWRDRYHIDKGNRTIDYATSYGYFSRTEYSAAERAENLYWGITDSRVTAPPTKDGEQLSLGDFPRISGFDDAHSALAAAAVQTEDFLRETRNDIVLTAATAGIPGVLFGKPIVADTMVGARAARAGTVACEVGSRGKTAKAPNSNSPYALFNKTHAGSQPVPKGLGPNGGPLQSHHGLQQEWAANNIPGYGPGLAPTVTLENGKGLPHTIITTLQRQRRDARVAAGLGKWSSSIDDELRFIVSDFRQAGFGDDVVKQVLEQNYKMLDKLGISYTKPAGF